MAIFDKGNFQALALVKNQPCVSIYMPTHRAGIETLEGEDAKHFKNKLLEAERLLGKKSFKKAEAEELLEKGFKLLEDKDFWRHQMDGLAVFIAIDFFAAYRLPTAMEHHVVVNDKFFLKPLIPALTTDDRFYLLSLSQKQVRLFQGTHSSLSQVDISDEVPVTFDEALGGDMPEKQLQYHAMTRTGAGPASAPKTAMFHGQRSDEHIEEREVKKYFDMVDKGLHRVMNGDNAPLVLAGVDALMPIYRNASNYKHIIPENIKGNQEHVNLDRLHEKALRLVQKEFDNGIESDLNRYHEMAGTGKASDQLRDVVYNANIGMIDTLFLQRNHDVWGRFDISKQKTEVHKSFHEGDDELLNMAAVLTILTGGKVHVVDKEKLPTQHAPMAAIFRNTSTAVTT